jgi:hypothetical protein
MKVFAVERSGRIISSPFEAPSLKEARRMHNALWAALNGRDAAVAPLVRIREATGPEADAYWQQRSKIINDGGGEPDEE